jgi:uncharacterized protein (TIGR03492 family)
MVSSSNHAGAAVGSSCERFQAELPPQKPRILFISNGHGEDAIAAQIVARLPAGVAAEAYPTLGAGTAYAGLCPVVGPRAELASQGWRNFRGSLARDMATGGFRTLWPGLRFFRSIRGRYASVVVVGDMVGLAGCLFGGIKDVVYLDVYRTGYGRLYAAPECWLVRRTSRVAFCRHEALAARLRRRGVDARVAGNVMMDAIPYGAYDAAARRRAANAVTLLPGSRQWVEESFARQVEALRRLPEASRPDLFLALAGGIPAEALGRAAGLAHSPPASGEAADRGTLSDGTLTVHVAQGALGNLVEASDLVLSQAGTATIQALGLGRPVVTFVTPRDRPSRVRDENAQFGEARRIVAPEPQRIAEAVAALLADGDERARLGAIGRQRIGGPGAMAAILGEILKGLVPEG